MAGSLIKIDEFTVSSAVASVILGGGSSGSSSLNASIDSTYDVYMVTFNNVAPATDATNLRVRFTVSGTADSSSNYDRALKKLNAHATFGDTSSTNQDHLRTSSAGIGTNTSEIDNGILYLFNFNNASEYSFITIEETLFSSSETHSGNQGGGVLTVAQACDGIQFLMSSSGNIASGTFKLYGLKK
tara:strand:+ start:191 stop:748 length:558 start_codon:yes stop_codon:yes gene_type:complete